ncbi:hypothetical protein Tco_1493195 [Tanacetum coccineum]
MRAQNSSGNYDRISIAVTEVSSIRTSSLLNRKCAIPTRVDSVTLGKDRSIRQRLHQSLCPRYILLLACASIGRVARDIEWKLYDSKICRAIECYSDVEALASGFTIRLRRRLRKSSIQVSYWLSNQKILSDIVKCIGDNKKHMRECRLARKDAITYLTDAKLGAEGRKYLFDWLSRELAGLADFPDNVQVFVAMMASNLAIQF